MKKTVLFGDSLTAGRIGIAYRRYIPLPTEVHGIEGDTFFGVIKRIQRYVKAKHPGKQTVLVIQAGANDILLPYMATHYQAWKQAVQNLTLDTTLFEKSDEHFEERAHHEINSLIEMSLDTHIILCSLPVLGENLASPLHAMCLARNEILYRVGEKNSHIQWCDIATPLIQQIQEEQGSSSYLPERPESLEEDVSYIGTDEVKAASVSQERALVVTIDGIHPNAKGAQIIASALSSVLPR